MEKNTTKNINVNITLDQWACTVSVLGICATYAFICYTNNSSIPKISRKS